MRVNNILGIAAVAGAAWFLRSEKGRNMIEQFKPQFDSLCQKGEEAFRNVSDRVRSTFDSHNPVS